MILTFKPAIPPPATPIENQISNYLCYNTL